MNKILWLGLVFILLAFGLAACETWKSPSKVTDTSVPASIDRESLIPAEAVKARRSIFGLAATPDESG